LEGTQPQPPGTQVATTLLNVPSPPSNPSLIGVVIAQTVPVGVLVGVFVGTIAVFVGVLVAVLVGTTAVLVGVLVLVLVGT
jgi:hypothetical protein